MSFSFVISRTYRTPSIVEKEMNMLAFGLITIASDYDLEPEEVDTIEAGYRSLSEDGRLSCNANVFYTRIKDIADLYNGDTAPALFTMRYINNGKIITSGLELGVQYELFDNVSLLVDYSYIDSKAKPDIPSVALLDKDSQLSNNAVGSGIRYTQGGWQCDLYLKYIAEHEDLNEPVMALFGRTDKQMPAYITSFARIAYDFTLAFLNDAPTQVELVFNNLGHMHREYAKHDYYIEPEIWGGVKVQF